MQTQDKTKSKTEEKPRTNINIPPGWPNGLIISNRKSIEISVADNLAVILTKGAFEQLFGWAYSTSREISCLGSVRRESNRFLIEQFYLLKQSGSSANTELDQTAIAELIEQLVATSGQQQAQKIKCWAHSHPNMETFWSQTDDETCRLLVNDYLISIVVSNNFTIRCRIDITSPIPVMLDNVPVLYQIGKDNISLDKYTEEVRSIVSEKVFITNNAEEKKGQEDLFAPIAYCDYCGYCHGPGECPLVDPGRKASFWDDDNIPF